MPVAPLINGRFAGLVYRGLNPVYGREPLSGRGAAIFGGRFNKKGREALYAALSPATAIRECNQVGTLQPTTLVAYRADIGPVFDARNEAALQAYGVSGAKLSAQDWRIRMLEGREVPGQILAERLLELGYAGLLTPSFAKGASGRDVNLVLWHWNTGAMDRLELVDDEDRLL